MLKLLIFLLIFGQDSVAVVFFLAPGCKPSPGSAPSLSKGSRVVSKTPLGVSNSSKVGASGPSEGVCAQHLCAPSMGISREANSQSSRLQILSPQRVRSWP